MGKTPHNLIVRNKNGKVIHIEPIPYWFLGRPMNWYCKLRLEKLKRTVLKGKNAESYDYVPSS